MHRTLLPLALLVASPAWSQPPEAVAVVAPGGTRRLDMAALASMPQARATLPVEPGRAGAPRVYSGPLLWTVLGAPSLSPRAVAGSVVRVTGADGYDAVLALAEIAPGFDGRRAILADRSGDAPLVAPRLVVPDDGRPARSVRDVARIAVSP